MADSLSVYMTKSPTEYTLSDRYKSYIESLLPVLRNTGNVRQIYVEPEVGYLNRFDMTAFLLENSIPLEDHYLILRLNGMTSIQEIDEQTNFLTIPDQELVSKFKQIFRTTL